MNEKFIYYRELHYIFFNLNIEDKVSHEGRGNDRVSRDGVSNVSCLVL